MSAWLGRTLVALVAPVILLLTACGQGDSTMESSTSSTSVSASPTVSTTPSQEPSSEPAEEVTEEPAEEIVEEPEQEPEPTQSVANLEATDDERRAIYASADELAAINAERRQYQIDQGYDPEDDYVKYGEVLCHGDAFPTSDELASVGASQAFIDWYAQYVAEAPQYVLDMSAANRAVEEQGAVAPAVDQQQCSLYGLS